VLTLETYNAKAISGIRLY